MMTLTQATAPWHEFYSLLGQASATMIGLLFVAASVGAGVFTQSGRGGLRMFLTSSVVQFGSTLAGCLIVLVPIRQWEVFGALVSVLGVFGLVYSALAWRDASRDGLIVKIDWEDRSWYGLAPAVAYLLEITAGVILMLKLHIGCCLLAAALGGLLLMAIHNAWDITVWSVTRRKDQA